MKITLKCRDHDVQLNSNMRPELGGTHQMFNEDFVDMLDSLMCPLGGDACEYHWFLNDIRMVFLQDGAPPEEATAAIQEFAGLL